MVLIPVKKPAVEGWFAWESGEPHLIGTRCKQCGSYFFPNETAMCRNPRCTSEELEELALSRRGTLWSYTNNCYQPPAPYVSPDPFVPYVVAAVELEREGLVVLGQVVGSVTVEDLRSGMTMELVVDTLFKDDEQEAVIWKWKPVEEGA